MVEPSNRGEIVTLMFTDLVGSTELFARLGDDAAEDFRRTHFGLLRDAVARGGGQEVKNLGDGLMVVFGSAVDAVHCAVAIQRAVQEHNRSGNGTTFHVRIGLHAGEPVREEGDYFGMAVIVAKRLCDVASGGAILASGLVTGLVGSRGGLRFEPLTPQALKGVPEPVPAAAVAWQPPLAAEPALPRYLVLGPVEARDADDGALPLTGARQRLLLAVLLAAQGAVVSTDALLEALWGDEQPVDPRGSLQSQVWRLRKGLGADPSLQTTPDGYRVDVEAGCDAHLFEQLMARARAETDPAAALACWEQALALWRGPAFLGLADHPALLVSAAALTAMRSEAAHARAQTLLALGRLPEALAAAESASREDPFAERPVEIAMRALTGQARTAEALSAYDAFRRRLAEETGLDPSAALAAVQAEILGAAPGTAPARSSHPPAPPVGARVNRPASMAAPIDAFIGREAELRQVRALLGRARLVTVTGPGGMGKTRLSMQVVEAVAADYPDGVWCLDLTAAAGDAQVPDAVATMVRVEARAGSSMTERIVEFLAAKHALLVFDNCEHVIDAAADLARAVLAGENRVGILATSREALGLPGEQRVPLDPLAVPAQLDADAPAVRLFVGRAAAADPNFRLDEDNLADVCELCRRVDGLPLAIELAAARVAARGVAEVNAEVGKRLAELGGGGRGRVARHRSTDAVVGWSYDLLSEPDSALFERLAVFAGGWSAHAAEGVCDGAGGGRVVDRLVRLVEQSLVVARPHGSGTRYTMLEPIRAYAWGRLVESGNDDEVRAAHARYFVDLAEQADAGMRTPDEPTWVARLDREVSNLRVAHRRLVESGDADGDLRLVAALYWYGYAAGAAEVFGWAEEAARQFTNVTHPSLPTVCGLGAVGAWRRGDLERARTLAEQGIAAAASDPATGRIAREALGDVHGFQGDFAAACEHFLAARDLAHSVGDHLLEGLTTADAAMVVAYSGDTQRACELAEQVMAMALDHPCPSLLAFAHYVAGEVLLDANPAGARPLLEQSLVEAGKVPNRFVLGIAGVSAIAAAARTGDSDTALARYPDLIEHWSRAGAWNQQWLTIRTLIETLTRIGASEAAAVLHGALCASPSATALVGADAERLQAAVGELTARLGEDERSALQARGAALGDAGAVGYALTTVRALVGSR
jgi:predicted ATPase/class 3 adenylate cyclase/DNA-binding SARP family transcriptional activator